MSLIIQKFGGSSVADTHHLFNVAKKITDLYSKGNSIVVVVSAQGDTTDDLLENAYNICAEPPLREMDALLSAGEQMSAALLSIAITNLGFPAVSLTGWQAGFITDSCHGDAKILDISVQRIKSELEQKNIVIIAGFQGIDKNQDITTLGRGGSDTSAVALAGAMGADMCKIYTDVDGIYTADPRIVSCAKKIDNISYEEMFELSCYGAQVLNDRSIETAKKYSVEVEVLSAIAESGNGTIVKSAPIKSVRLTSGIAVLDNLAKIKVTDLDDKDAFKSKILFEIKKEGISSDFELTPLGSAPPKTLIITVPESKVMQTVKIIQKHLPSNGKSQVFYEKRKSEISVINICENMNINIASIVFETLAQSEIAVEMIACTKTRVSVIISSQQMHTALNVIHSQIFEEDNLL